jgi:hypothetical protein
MFLILNIPSVACAAAVFILAALALPGRRGTFFGAALAVVCLVFIR